MNKRIKFAMKSVHIVVFLIVILLGNALFSYAGTTTTTATGRDYVLQLKLFEQVIQRLRLTYVEEPNPEELVEGAIEGMLGKLDEHTMYFNPDDFELFLDDAEGSFGGMGVTIQVTPEDNTLTVMSVLEGTPAERVGLMPRDKIIEIEGESTIDITTRDALKKMRGEPDTELNITIAREGFAEPLHFLIVREIIRLEAIPYYFMVTEDIGYIRLTSFARDEERSSSGDLKNSIADLKTQGMTNLILDIRGNPGGLLDEAVEISSCFLPKNKLVVSTKGRSSQWKDREYLTTGNPVFPDGDMVLLVDGASASASEIVTGALKDYERATIIGETTFGKASVQSIVPLGLMMNDDKIPGMKMTVAHYYTPSGHLIHDAGIEPDMVEEFDAFPILVNKLFADGQFRLFAQKYHDKNGDAALTKFLNDPMLLPQFEELIEEDEFKFFPEEYAKMLPDEGKEFTIQELRNQEELVIRLMTREMYREMEGDERAYEFWRQDDKWINVAIGELS